MGIGIVLLGYLIFGTIVAGIGALILAVGMTVLTRKGQSGRRSAIVLSVALPFIGLCWWSGLFVFQATINGAVFHRDPGLGDAWYTPLPNGYTLNMRDVMDTGFLAKGGPFEEGEQSETDSNISQLQIVGPYMLGRYGEPYPDGNVEVANHYFLLDTGTGKRQIFADMEGLRKAVVPLGIQPALEPVRDVYGHYRNTWFDYFVLSLYLGYPIWALTVWVRRVRRVRQAPILAAA